MDISKIDRNFKIETDLPEKDIEWFEADKAPFVMYGALTGEKEGYPRIPQALADKVNDGVACLNKMTAGVRVRVCTDSPYIAVKAIYPNIGMMSHMTLLGSSGFDIYRVKNGQQFFMNSVIPPIDMTNGFDYLFNTFLGGTMTDYIINFPPYNQVIKVYLGVKAGSHFSEPQKYKNEKPVVFYGSSITQGGCASRPGNMYQNFLSRKLDMDYLCLGFSGSGKAEKNIVEYMSKLSMSVFVADYDHNAPNADYLRNTHYTMYEAIREKNPDLPYIMITAPDPTPNWDWTERRAIIMESYVKAIKNGDRNVYFIDGRAFSGGNDYDCVTVDRSHPNDIGFLRMAEGIYPVLREILYK